MDESTILANMEVTYLYQLSHPAPLIIGHRVVRVGNKSYDLLSGVFQKLDSLILCYAYLRMVAFNYKTNQTVDVPKIIKEHCNPLST